MIRFGKIVIEACPKCGSKNIEVSGATFSASEVSANVKCLGCGHKETVKKTG